MSIQHQFMSIKMNNENVNLSNLGILLDIYVKLLSIEIITNNKLTNFLGHPAMCRRTKKFACAKIQHYIMPSPAMQHGNVEHF